MWRGTVVSFYCQGYVILLPGWTPSTLTLCHQHFFQAWNVGGFFLFLFLPHLFFVTVCYFLNLNSSFPFYSPSHWLKSCYFFSPTSWKPFPISLLTTGVDLFFIWTSLCFAVLLVALNAFYLVLWLSDPLYELWPSWGQVQYVDKSGWNNC